ncbi:hypothetical protein [Sphingopyxis macrogoltabida]|nr:hypothetical protein [Sphingopyxis macrogoltabida]
MRPKPDLYVTTSRCVTVLGGLGCELQIRRPDPTRPDVIVIASQRA